MNVRAVFLAVFLLFGSCTLLLCAESEIDAFIAKALSGAPNIESLKAKLEASRESIEPAGAFPDPMLELTGQIMGVNPPGPGSSGIIEYRQEFPYPGKRKARVNAAEADSLVKKAEIELLERQITADIRTIFARIYALDKELDNLESAKELLKLLSSATSARYSSGESSREAILKIDLESSLIEERMNEIESERLIISSGLTALINSDEEEIKIMPVMALPEIKEPAEKITASADKSAFVAVKEAELNLAIKVSEDAALYSYPDFTVGGGFGIDGDKKPVLMLSFGIQLPVWNSSKQAPLKRAADKEVVAARADLLAAKLAAKSEALRLAAQWKKNEKLIKQYKETIIPKNISILEAVRTAYIAGQSDFPAVIEDSRALLDAKIRLARLEADRFMVWAAIMNLTMPASHPMAMEK